MELTTPNISVPRPSPELTLGHPEKRPRWKGSPVVWVKVLEWLTVVLCATGMLMAGVLILRFKQAPVVVDRLTSGQMVWRTTERFQVGAVEMRAFLAEVMSVLFSITPGSYDPTVLRGRVGDAILKTFAEQSGPGLQVGQNQRRRYYYLDARRHVDPAIPSQLIFLVRGENVLLTFNPAAAAPFERSEGEKWHLVYVDEVPVTPENPYGLFVPYIEIVEEARAREYWERGTPLGLGVGAPEKGNSP